MLQMNEFDFNALGNGALKELFDNAVGDVLKNIDNPVAKKKTKRQIVIKIGMNPNDDGSSCELDFDVETKLAKTTPTIKSTAFIGMDGGRPVIREWSRGQLPGQLSHEDYIEPKTEPMQPTTATKGFK